MSAIPVRIPIDELERIDQLVRKGRFKNRSEALKHFISTSLGKEEMLILEQDVDMTKINILLSKVRNNKNFINISSEKSAVELVGEGRSR